MFKIMNTMFIFLKGLKCSGQVCTVSDPKRILKGRARSGQRNHRILNSYQKTGLRLNGKPGGRPTSKLRAAFPGIVVRTRLNSN
jgi:hypothetical protein